MEQVAMSSGMEQVAMSWVVQVAMSWVVQVQWRRIQSS